MTVLLTKEADGKILIMTLSGKLSVDDYAHFAVEVERAIAEHGKIRFLVEMYEYHNWTAAALWEDIKFDVSHYAHIERVTLAGDRSGNRAWLDFARPSPPRRFATLTKPMRTKHAYGFTKKSSRQASRVAKSCCHHSLKSGVVSLS